ncbi:methyltransferase domain-containing protein [Streptomyces sp. SID10853]|uniref:methyltransferase domain-containing protein n=1 Tax=Streptomyces sp. SID10853 TaxID=2706028 RepID=UPI0013C05CD2|nr:methyltransferase domain-containing protein [Streptomyces sp. SID10853]NDZ80335.1 methyltransferase domain-containing protein [Streptomyces sp. SID10853]
MADDGADHGYLLDNRQSEAGVRFDALAELFDPVTFRHVDGLGITDGMRCWEIGAGGPSVPRGLAARVGPAGSVLATDIDTSWTEAALGTGGMSGTGSGASAGGTIEVLRHDVAADPPPPGGFDLVHARLVLVHVTDRAEALRRMVRALRPGGWLLVEDADPGLQPLLCPDESGPEQRLANRLRTGFRELMAARGADLAYGRTLPRLLREAGLDDVRADAYFPITSPACTTLEAATVRQIRARLVAAGLATDQEIDQHLANVATGRLDLATSPMISAWGRRPGRDSAAAAPERAR